MLLTLFIDMDANAILFSLLPMLLGGHISTPIRRVSSMSVLNVSPIENVIVVSDSSTDQQK